MLATLISATRKLYTVRVVPCVALVGVGFLLMIGRECHSDRILKYEKTCLVSSERTKNNFSEITKKNLQIAPGCFADIPGQK